MKTTKGVILTFIIVPFVLVKTQNFVLDCNGRSSICVGPLSYKNCIENGNGFVATEKELVQICPPNTFCSYKGTEICIPLQEFRDENNQIATQNKTQYNHSEISETVTDRIAPFKTIREISYLLPTTNSLSTEFPDNLYYENASHLVEEEGVLNAEHLDHDTSTRKEININDGELQNEIGDHILEYQEIEEQQTTLDDNLLNPTLTTVADSTQTMDSQDSESTSTVIQTTTEMLGLTEELTTTEVSNNESQFTTLTTYSTYDQSTFSDRTEKNIISTEVSSSLGITTTSSEILEPLSLSASTDPDYSIMNNQIQKSHIGENENSTGPNGSGKTNVNDGYSLMTNPNLLAENNSEINQLKTEMSTKSANISNLSSTQLESDKPNEFNQSLVNLIYEESTPSNGEFAYSTTDFTTEQLNNNNFSNSSHISIGQNSNETQFENNAVDSTPKSYIINSSQNNSTNEVLYNSDIVSSENLLKTIEGEVPKISSGKIEEKSNDSIHSATYSPTSLPDTFSESSNVNIIKISDPTKFENTNISRTFSTSSPENFLSNNFTRIIADTNEIKEINSINDSDISSYSQVNSELTNVQNINMQIENNQSNFSEPVIFPNNEIKRNQLEIQRKSDQNSTDELTLTTEIYGPTVRKLIIEKEIFNTTNSKPNTVNSVNLNTIPETRVFSNVSTITANEEKLTENQRKINNLLIQEKLATTASHGKNKTKSIIKGVLSSTMGRPLNQIKKTLGSLNFSDETSEQSSKIISLESSEDSSREYSLEEISKSRKKSHANVSSEISSESKISTESSEHESSFKLSESTHSSFSNESNTSSKSNNSSEKDEIDNQKKSDLKRKLKNREKKLKAEKKRNKFRCEKEGKFPDSLNCRKYYMCLKRDDNTLKKYKFKCLDYHVFDPELSKCIYSTDIRCVILRT